MNIGEIYFHRIEYIWIQGQMGSNKDYKEVEIAGYLFSISLDSFSIKGKII